MTSGYDRTPIGLTDSEGRGKKSQYRREGNPRRVPCVSFWNKINHFRGNQRSCSSEKFRLMFFVLDCWRQNIAKTILRLCFLLDHAFGHAPGATLSPLPPLPLGQNFALGKKPQVEIVTAFSSLVAETFVILDSCSTFPLLALLLKGDVGVCLMSHFFFMVA